MVVCYAAHFYVTYSAILLKGCQFCNANGIKIQSNLTWAEIQVEKQIIEQQEPIFMFIGLLLIAIVFVVSMTMQ